MKLAVLFALLGLAATGHAIKCYACRSTEEITGVSTIGSALSLLINAPPCTQFEPGNPDWNKKFIRECADDRGCMKVADPNDSTNEARGCFPTAKDECADGACYCKTDLCNSSDRRWSSAVLLLLAALAAVF